MDSVHDNEFELSISDGYGSIFSWWNNGYLWAIYEELVMIHTIFLEFEDFQYVGGIWDTNDGRAIGQVGVE